MKNILHQVLLSLSISVAPLLVTAAFAADPPKKSSWEYWVEADKTRQQVRELRKNKPQEAAKLLEDALENVADSHVAADLFTTLGEIYTVDLKQPGEALKLYERALPLFQKPEAKIAPYHELTMRANQAHALLAAKRLPDAEKALNESRVLLGQSAIDENHYSVYAVRLTLSAQLAFLEAQNQSDKAVDFLKQFLMENPRFLQVSSDWESPENNGGYALRELLRRLQQQKHSQEALSWGKLVYRLSAFDKKEIEQATKLLTRLWAEQENFPAIAQWNKAQTDPTAPNPLAKIALPELPATVRETLRKKADDLAGRQIVASDPQRGRQLVTLSLMLGTPNDVREAMNQAYALLKKHPDLQDGALQICRVFKAADLNLVRANAFLNYLEGQGENPVPAFLQETAPAAS